MCPYLARGTQYGISTYLFFQLIMHSLIALRYNVALFLEWRSRVDVRGQICMFINIKKKT